MIRLLLIALALLTTIALSSEAKAQSCSFSVSNPDFGNVDTLSGGVDDTAATVNISCGGAVLGATVRVCLNINAGSGGATSGIRHMRNASSAPLNYQLYKDAAHSLPWGSVEQPALGTPVVVDLTLPLLGGTVATTRTIYGRVLGSQQSAPAGSYSSAFAGAEVRFNWTTYLLTPPDCSTVAANPIRPAFNVLANVAANCSVSAQNLDFGPHGVLSANVDANGGIDVTCTPGTNYAIGLNGGLSGAPPTQRQMKQGSQVVFYGLYRNMARSLAWGNGAGETLAGTGTGALQNLPVYGRVPAQTTPSPGLYADTIVVTVTY